MAFETMLLMCDVNLRDESTIKRIFADATNALVVYVVVCVPDEWENAIVTPVHKKVLLMYLPTAGQYPLLAFHVSYWNALLSAKSMSTLNKIIYSVANSMVFIAGRSTRTKILECLNDWICNLQDVSLLLLL